MSYELEGVIARLQDQYTQLENIVVRLGNEKKVYIDENQALFRKKDDLDAKNKDLLKVISKLKRELKKANSDLDVFQNRFILLASIDKRIAQKNNLNVGDKTPYTGKTII